MKTLLSENTLREGVSQLCDQINTSYEGRPLTILGVMTGSIILVADMIRQLTMPLRVGVVQASSYRDATTPGDLVIKTDLMPDVTGQHVLVIDDIFDTGNTMSELLKRLEQFQPASVRSGVLLLKSGRQEVAMRPDYVAFEIPDEFVVGYGLDYRDEYRNLPFVATLEEDEIQRPVKGSD